MELRFNTATITGTATLFLLSSLSVCLPAEKGDVPILKTDATSNTDISVAFPVGKATMWETWEKGEVFHVSLKSSEKILSSLKEKPKPTEAALKAAKEFNRRVRETNGVRTII